MGFTPFAPVSFGEDINNADGCEGCGQPFSQLVQQGDCTQFQLPNTLKESLGGNIFCNPTFDDTEFCADFQKGTGNSGVDVWSGADTTSIGGSTNQGIGVIPTATTFTSKIFNFLLDPDIAQWQKYKIKFKVLLPATCTLYFVGYKSYASDASTDYDILGSMASPLDSTGAGIDFWFEFIATNNYMRLGFYVVGDTNDVEILIDDMYVYATTYSGLTVCIEDNNGNVINNLSEDAYTYYAEFIVVSFCWDSDLALADGCYKICICEGDFQTNIMVFGDGGTMEANTTGIDGVSDTPAIHSSEQFYRGIYSAKTDFDMAVAWVFEGAMPTLKPNTQYAIKCKVYIPDNGYTPSGNDLAITPLNVSVSVDSSTVIIITDNLDTWAEVGVIFTTGTTVTGGLIQITAGGDLTQFNGFPIYTDEWILYETADYVPCSQIYDLRATHLCSLLLSWTNDDDAFGFYYLQGGFVQYARVAGRLRNPKYPGGIEAFNNSVGAKKIIWSEVDKIWEMAIEEMPEYMHDAIAVGIKHDTLTIEGAAFICEKADYEPQWRKTSSLAPVMIDVQKTPLNLVNYNC